MCICGEAVDNGYPDGWRSFCSGTCAARAASAVAYAERAQTFLAGLAISSRSEVAMEILLDLRSGLADVRKGPQK